MACKTVNRGASGPNFMAQHTISKELVLTEAGNSALMPKVFHRLTWNSCLCTCLLYVTGHSFLTQLAQQLGTCTKRRMVIVSAELGSKQCHEVGPRSTISSEQVNLIFVPRSGVFGGLDLHGKNHSVYWTQLSATVYPGQNNLTVVAKTDWVVGDEIVVATSSFVSWQTETFTIVAVINSSTFKINGTFEFKHSGKSGMCFVNVTGETRLVLLWH